MLETILSSLGTLASSGATGGLLGLLGAVSSGLLKNSELERDYKWRVKSSELDIELLRAQVQADAAGTLDKLRLTEREGSWRGLEASIKAESKLTASSRWVRDLRALFRPLLTILLLTMTASILAGTLYGFADPFSTYITVPVISELVIYTAHTIVTLCAMSVAWWFGDRAMSLPAKK